MAEWSIAPVLKIESVDRTHLDWTGRTCHGLSRNGFAGDVKVLTSCPSCLQGLSRFDNDSGTTADYIVVEIAKHILGKNWMPEYVKKANEGGIERVLL